MITAIGLDGVSVAQQLEVAVSRTLGPASLDPSVFTPNGDGTGDALAVSFELAAPASVRLRVLRDGAWVATPFTGPLPAGTQTVGWDGTKRVGQARDGSYTAVLDVTDTIATSEVSLPFQMDAHPPTIKLLARPPRIWVSEAAAVTVRVNGALRHLDAPAAGALPLSGIRKVRTLVVVARDTAGNKAVFRRP